MRVAVCLVVLLTALPCRPVRADGLTILHINDLHGWLLPHRTSGSGRPEGGVARMAALVQRERTEKTLFVAAGDLMQGTNISNLFHGRPVIESLGLMGLDASAVGNHDFDYGLEVLGRRASEASFPFLAANIGTAGNGFSLPWTIRRVGSLRIGLFGLTTVDTPRVTHPKNVAGLTFSPPAEAARTALSQLRDAVDIVVCLSHLGLEGDIELARSVPGIDVIVGGHTHTSMERPILEGSTIIVQAFERGIFLGRLDLMIEGGRIVGHEGKLLPVDGSAGEDRAVAVIIERYRKEADASMGEAVGTAGVAFDGSRDLVRSRETNLGSLLADAVREAAGADVALINGGSIRAGIPAGTVTVAHIYNTLPFDNYVITFSLSGSEIRTALETGLSRIEEGGGGFPQVSGLSFTFDSQEPAGSRVREILVGRRPVEDEGRYIVATNDFLAAGGDGYDVFDGKEPLFVDSGRFVRELLADYWRARLTLSRQVSGRIVKLR